MSAEGGAEHRKRNQGAPLWVGWFPFLWSNRLPVKNIIRLVWKSPILSHIYSFLILFTNGHNQLEDC